MHNLPVPSPIRDVVEGIVGVTVLGDGETNSWAAASTSTSTSTERQLSKPVSVPAPTSSSSTTPTPTTTTTTSGTSPTHKSGLSMLLRKGSFKTIDVDALPTVTSPEHHRYTPSRKVPIFDLLSLEAKSHSTSASTSSFFPQSNSSSSSSSNTTTSSSSTSSSAARRPSPRLQNCTFCSFLFVAEDGQTTGGAKFCTPVCCELFLSAQSRGTAR